jgi:hypothetical protein
VRAHIGLLDDPPSLAEDGGGDEDLLADHGVVLVVRVVGVVELAVGAELMPELALVPHVVPKVELSITHSAAVLAAAHRHRFLFFLSSSPLSVRVDWGFGVGGRRKRDVLASPPLVQVGHQLKGLFCKYPSAAPRSRPYVLI